MSNTAIVLSSVCAGLILIGGGAVGVVSTASPVGTLVLITGAAMSLKAMSMSDSPEEQKKLFDLAKMTSIIGLAILAVSGSGYAVGSVVLGVGLLSGVQLFLAMKLFEGLFEGIFQSIDHARRQLTS